MSSRVNLFLGVPNSYSQIKSPGELRAAMSKGNANGWKVFIPKNDSKAAQAGWRKFCKNYEGKVIKVKKSNDYLTTAVAIPSLGEGTYNLYAQFSETPEGVFMMSFVEIGGSFLNSHQHKEQSKEWSRLIKGLAKGLTIDAIESEMKREEKALRDSNRDLDKLIKDKRTFEKDISDCEKTIEDRKSQLVTNAKDQETQKSDIIEQEKQVDKVKNELKRYSN